MRLDHLLSREPLFGVWHSPHCLGSSNLGVWVGVGLGVRVSLPVWGGGVDAVEVGWASEGQARCRVHAQHLASRFPRVGLPVVGGCCVGCGGFVGWVCVPARAEAVCGWGVGVVGCL